MSDMPRNALIENIATIVGTVALVLGLWWMGAGGWSFFGLLLMLNINYANRRS